MAFLHYAVRYLGVALCMGIAAFVGQIVYNLYFHPLRSYPGPWAARAGIYWFLYHTVVGDYTFAVHKAHLAYGPVVRVAPNELAYTDVRAWKDIYGHRVGAPENIKDPSQIFDEEQSKHPSIIFAPREKHSQIRRLVSNAFSDKSLREQEPVLKMYTQLLVDQLSKRTDKPIDIVKWYNFTTFDVIGHLAFAESFNCLSNSDYHPWVEMIFINLKFVAFSQALNRIRLGLATVLAGLIPRRVLREAKSTFEMAHLKLHNRKQKQPRYTDFMTHLIAAEEKGQINPEDLTSNAPVFVVAGSETTATLLSGATYLLLTNPRVYSLLTQEIRAAFGNETEISIARAGELRYLSAVIDESLRLYPPAPTSHPRLLPRQGATIAGQYVPGGFMAGINQYSMSRSPLNFSRPEEFIPERFLLAGDEEWSREKREALQPFSHGPRNCVGRNLAYIEMRLILCELLSRFDLVLMPESDRWIDQKIFTSWDKKPLMVKLQPVT